MSKNIKTKEALLKAYKKSNKVRRTVLLSKSGYATETEYLNFLTGVKVVAKTSKVKVAAKTPVVATTKKTKGALKTVHNVYILDSSGSMGAHPMTNSKFNMAILGINSELKELRTDKSVKYKQGIVIFSNNNRIKTPIWNAALKDVNDLNAVKEFHGQQTALNDAIGSTLSKLLNIQQTGEKVLVKIFTDGGENNSKNWDKEQIKKLISDCEAKGFTIAFVGTEMDTKSAIHSYGINVSNTLVHSNTPESVKMSFSASTESTRSYSKKVAKGEDVTMNFFSKKVGKL
jgi:hypothetical protein